MLSSGKPMQLAANTAALLLILTGCAAGTQRSPSTIVPQTSPAAAPGAISIPTTIAPPIDTTTAATSATSASAVPWVAPCGQVQRATPTYEHVIWIWMENKNRSEVFDSKAAPFMHSIAASCGTASNYVDHGIHPSLPNYIAATSGGTQGITDDGSPRAHPLHADNIFRQVRAIGKLSKSYQESMPSNCSLQSTNRYAVKHNPAAYYGADGDRTACERDDVAFDNFLPDLQRKLPAFSLITPDICNDMHDCSVATGDKWLQGVVSRITNSATYRERKTAVFIVFDESEAAGNMPFIAIAPSIAPGTKAATELDHYSLLAFTEDALGIATRLGHAGAASSLAKAFGL
jgi:hypothetical protein